jgi:hypothetical protein
MVRAQMSALIITTGGAGYSRVAGGGTGQAHTGVMMVGGWLVLAAAVTLCAWVSRRYLVAHPAARVSYSLRFTDMPPYSKGLTWIAIVLTYLGGTLIFGISHIWLVGVCLVLLISLCMILPTVIHNRRLTDEPSA